jgi:hypothetical protein
MSSGTADDQEAAYLTPLGYTFLIKELWAKWQRPIVPLEVIKPLRIGAKNFLYRWVAQITANF